MANLDEFLDDAGAAIRQAESFVRMKYGGVIVNLERHTEEITDPNSGMRRHQLTGEITITVKRD